METGKIGLLPGYLHTVDQQGGQWPVLLQTIAKLSVIEEDVDVYIAGRHQSETELV